MTHFDYYLPVYIVADIDSTRFFFRNFDLIGSIFGITAICDSQRFLPFKKHNKFILFCDLAGYAYLYIMYLPIGRQIRA